MKRISQNLSSWNLIIDCFSPSRFAPPLTLAPRGAGRPAPPERGQVQRFIWRGLVYKQIFTWVPNKIRWLLYKGGRIGSWRNMNKPQGVAKYIYPHEIFTQQKRSKYQSDATIDRFSIYVGIDRLSIYVGIQIVYPYTQGYRQFIHIGRDRSFIHLCRDKSWIHLSKDSSFIYPFENCQMFAVNIIEFSLNKERKSKNWSIP